MMIVQKIEHVKEEFKLKYKQINHTYMRSLALAASSLPRM